MTAATVATPTAAPFTVDELALELGLEHPGAIAIAVLPTEERHATAARAAADRRTALGLYVTLYAERYGHRLDVNRLIAEDELLSELTLLTIA